MARQSTVFDKKQAQPVCCNLLHLEMTRRISANIKPVLKQPHTKTYFELVEQTTENGISEQLVERDYPITPDYVKSFEASANYKNDVNNAIANGVAGANIGNASALQELSKMDTAAIKDLQNKLSALAQLKQNQPVDNGGENNV